MRLFNLIRQSAVKRGSRGIRWLVVCALLVSMLSGPKALHARRRAVRFYAKPDQVAEMPAPSITAERPCENWAWAAGVEELLRSAGVSMPQKFWVVRANGGLVCVADPRDVISLNSFIDGDYALDDGRRIRLRSHFIPNGQITLDDVIVALRGGKPRLFFWNNRCYLLYGMVYDEFVGPSGVHRYQWKEFKLLDLTYSDVKQRLVSFTRDHQDSAQLSGILEISAATRDVFELPK